MISFALESPGFESHTDILFLISVIFMLFLLLLRDNGHLICDYIIGDRPFSHTGQIESIIVVQWGQENPNPRSHRYNGKRSLPSFSLER